MKKLQKGFSLIELLVALVLGLVLLTGSGRLFLATNKTRVLQDELSRIQENVRLAVDQLAKDIRTVSFTSCPANTSLANNLSAGTESREWMAHFDKGILGFSAGSEAKKIDSDALSQAIVVHSIDSEESISVAGHDLSTATATLARGHDYDEGDLLAFIAGDCSQVSVFRAGSDTGSNKVSHPGGSSGSLSNCISHLKGNYNCHTGTAEARSLSHTGSQLAPLYSYAYYVRNSNGIPTLYRKEAGEYPSGNAKNAEALVEGIENINILYGVDSDNDGIANQYHTADALGVLSGNWKKVTSVKLELLARSLNEVLPQPQTYFFAGEQIEPGDNYIRRTLITTIQLRNRQS